MGPLHAPNRRPRQTIRDRDAFRLDDDRTMIGRCRPQTFGCPTPRALTIIQPGGPVPAFDPTNPKWSAGSVETTLESSGSTPLRGARSCGRNTGLGDRRSPGFPEIVMAENYVDRTTTWATSSDRVTVPRGDLPTLAILRACRSAFENARRAQWTVAGRRRRLGAPTLNEPERQLPERVNSCFVRDTARDSVGGLSSRATTKESGWPPDVVWNDFACAGGGGVSAVFDRPSSRTGSGRVFGARGTPRTSA